LVLFRLIQIELASYVQQPVFAPFVVARLFSRATLHAVCHVAIVFAGDATPGI
jgi:hypothetical protein